ncbi:LCP family glycopolymer transferase [Oribacterium sp. HCP28S3_H8]|uniref:LCP family protein n=1 Tax=Oribacterium sp. HCP28S3_H8 TaxID=3438945 RepID=UPI003F894619
MNTDGKSRTGSTEMHTLRYRTRPVEASYEDDFDEEFQRGSHVLRRTPSSRSATDCQDTDKINVHRTASARTKQYRDDPYENSIRSTHSAGSMQSDPRRMQLNPGNPRRQHRRKKKFWKPIIAMVLILMILFGAWSFLRPYIGNKYWTLAVFGVDSRDGNLEAGALSDVIMVASINRRTKDVTLVSVYRDTYTQIDDKGTYHKLNEAYFKGGHTQAVHALERNLDLKIDDYITFNWAAVAKGINALGGVDLELSDAEFSYINAFITETVNSTGIGSTQLTHAGANHLDGVQAVAYGRLRLMDTDFNRTARQRKVISLALDKAKQADKKTLVSAAVQVIPMLHTSIGASDLAELAQNAGSYNIKTSTGFPFARATMNVGKMNVVVPATLRSNVVDLHKLLYDDQNYAVSDTVAKISAHIGEVTGVVDPEAPAPEAGTGGGKAKSGKSNTSVKTAKTPEIETEEILAEIEAETTASPAASETSRAAKENETIESIDELKSNKEQKTNTDTDKNSSSAKLNGIEGPGGKLTESTEGEEKSTQRTETKTADDMSIEVTETTAGSKDRKQNSKNTETSVEQENTAETKSTKSSSTKSGSDTNAASETISSGPGRDNSDADSSAGPGVS